MWKSLKAIMDSPSSFGIFELSMITLTI